MPKIADLVYEYTATTGTGPFTLAGARSSDFRTFAAAHSVGDTVYYSIRGGGQWEVGIGTLTASNILARTTVTNGSSGPGVAVNFAAGNKDIYETPHSGAYVGIDELSATSTFDDGDKLIVLKANGTVASILASIVKAASTGTPPATGDTTNPVMSGSLTTSNVTSSGYTMAWTAGTDNVAVTGYEISTDGGTTYTGVGNVLTRDVTGAAASTLYNLRVRAFDAAGNRSNALSATVTTSAGATTLATKYAMRNTDGLGGTAAVQYPASGNISTNGYYATNVSLYIRAANGAAAGAAEVVQWAWSKRSGSTPVQPDLSTYTQNGQKRPIARLGGWTDSDTPATNGYYGLYDNSGVGQLFVWGTAGTYDLWLFYSDGSAEPYDNGTGTPVGLVLT
jgi:hypothetical protein